MNNNIMNLETEPASEQTAPKGQVSRRKFLTAATTIASVLALGTDSAMAAPNGTRPTVLSITGVGSANSTKMRVTGRLTNLSGVGLAGMKVDIFSVTEASFTRWATVYTDSVGNFSATSLKIPMGAKIQVVVDGNGTYSQPFPTFNRI